MKKILSSIFIIITLAIVTGPIATTSAQNTQQPENTCFKNGIDITSTLKNLFGMNIASPQTCITRGGVWAGPNTIILNGEVANPYSSYVHCVKSFDGLTNIKTTIDAKCGNLSKTDSPYAPSPAVQTTNIEDCKAPSIMVKGTCVPPLPPPDLNYVLLAPLSTDGPDAMSLTNFKPGQTNPLGAYLNLMIKIVIGLASVMAITMIVIGGVEYMASELISGKEAAKTRISEAILGLLLALGSYALLNTINPDLLKTDLQSFSDTNATVEVDLASDIPQKFDPITHKSPLGAVYGSPWGDNVGAKAPDLPTDRIKINHNGVECAKIGDTNCTSTRALDTRVVKSIQLLCDCDILITGGTESWLHGGNSGNTSHMLGSSTVDIATSDKLDKYLSGGKPLIRMRRYPDLNGPYLYEGDHWHIGR